MNGNPVGVVTGKGKRPVLPLRSDGVTSAKGVGTDSDASRPASVGYSGGGVVLGGLPSVMEILLLFFLVAGTALGALAMFGGARDQAMAEAVVSTVRASLAIGRSSGQGVSVDGLPDGSLVVSTRTNGLSSSACVRVLEGLSSIDGLTRAGFADVAGKGGDSIVFPLASARDAAAFCSVAGSADSMFAVRSANGGAARP